MNTALIVSCLSFWSVSVMGTELIQGNVDPSTGQSFNFSIKGPVAGRNSFYVVASPTQAGAEPINEYALSALFKGDKKFTPLALKTVAINGVEANPNPIYNKKIRHLGLMEISDTSSVMPVYTQQPIVVTDDDNKAVYLLNPYFSADKVSMLSATSIKDANGAATNGIIGLTSGGNSIFAAVLANGSLIFGENGSGVALLAQVSEEFTENDVKQTKNVLKYFATTPLDLTSAVLKLAAGADLKTNIFVNDMWMDMSLGVFYMALGVQAGTAGGSGARAVVIGYVGSDRKIGFKAIAPDAVFTTADNQIVGTGLPNAQVTVHKIRTMTTSTWLHYLIMVGGNGDDASTKNQVYAVPLVNDPASTSFGSLAKYDSAPEDMYIGDEDHMAFNNRYFKVAATTNADILKSADAQAAVGGGVTPGNVLDIAVIGDSVVIAVDVAFTADTTKRRLFASRALFDAKGRINGWTNWQPVASTIGSLTGFSVDASDATITGLLNEDPSVDADVLTVRRSQWNFGDEGGLGDLNTVLGAEFLNSEGGIHGLFTFPEIYSGVTNASFAIVTGRKKIALVETGRGNPITVNKGNFSENTVNFSNGTITQTFLAGNATRVIVMSGGELDNLGAIQCAEISKSLQARLFFGGVGGLVALVNPDGSGITGDLKPGFEGLANGMLFKKIGNYQFVRKLICDGGELYVLTDKQLDRINLRGNNFTAVTLATADGIGGTFLDLTVSTDLALLATSVGLFRTGNGKNALTATSFDEAGWTPVALPENSGAVQQLNVQTKSGIAQNLENGGNVFALASYAGKNKAKWSRFSVADYTGTGISDTTVQPLPDIFSRSDAQGPVMSYFASFGTYRPVLAVTSALQLTSRDQDLARLAAMDSINPGLTSGARFAAAALTPITAATQNTSDINDVLRSSGSGDFLAAMDSGLKVNEFCDNVVAGA